MALILVSLLSNLTVSYKLDLMYILKLCLYSTFFCCAGGLVHKWSNKSRQPSAALRRLDSMGLKTQHHWCVVLLLLTIARRAREDRYQTVSHAAVGPPAFPLLLDTSFYCSTSILWSLSCIPSVGGNNDLLFDFCAGIN